MALDEALLAGCGGSEGATATPRDMPEMRPGCFLPPAYPVLRFYRWSPPCISIGRNQDLQNSRHGLIDMAAARRLGIDIYTGVRIESIERQADALAVSFNHSGFTKSVLAEVAAGSAGRVADIDDLDLQKAGIERDGRGVLTNAYLQTSNPDVFAAGDAVASSPQLSEVATYEGKLAARNLNARAMTAANYDSVPFVVYTVPEIAGVGLRPDEAQPGRHHVGLLDLTGLKTSRTYGESSALSKVVIEEGTGKVLGAHILGHRGEELINLFALAVRFGLTVHDINNAVFSFPSFSADVKDMLKG